MLKFSPRPPISLKDALLATVAALLGVLTALVPPGFLAIGVGVLIGIAYPVALYTITLMVAPLKTLIETETHLSLDPGQYAFMLTVAVVLMHRIAARKPLLSAFTGRGSGIVWALLIMTLSASFSLFSAESPAQTVTELVKWIEIAVMAAITVYVCEQVGYQAVLFGILGAAGVQAIIGIYQFLGGSGAAHLWILDNRFFRAFGTYGQPNPFGAHMELALMLGLGGLFGAITGRRLRLTLLLLPMCALLAAGLGVSWSRGAWLGAAAGLAAMILFAPRRRWIGGALVIGGVGGFIVLAGLGLLPGSVVARLSDFAGDLTGIDDVRGQEISNERYAVLERLAHWQAAIGMMTDHPWLGVGFGNYEVAYPHYALMNWKYPLGHAHNYYLNVWAETGLIGFVSYLFGCLAIIYLTIRTLSGTSGFNRGVVLGLLGVWIALCGHSLFDKLYVNNLFLHLGGMSGLIIVLRATPARQGKLTLHDAI